MDGSSITHSVAAQYDALPFPPRDPADEQKTLQAHTSFYGFDRINDVCFGGQRNLEDEGVRILVAGGGTGDAVISLGEQLRHTSSQIVYLDISAGALKVAQARAAKRNLTNVMWVRGSILDVPSKNLGMFDYVDCAGVLHHLEDPDAGLRALTSVVRPDGALGLLVYGALGRKPIYNARAELQPYLAPATTRQERLAVTRKFFRDHPDKNSKLADKVMGLSDAQLYDLLLHEQDSRPFTVPQLYTWLGKAGLHLAGFADARYGGNFGYDPQSYRSQPWTAGGSPPRPYPAEVAERLAGNISEHTFYATKRPNSAARSDDPDMVPGYSIGIGRELRAEIQQWIERNSGESLPIAALANGGRVRLEMGPQRAQVLGRIDGTTTLGQLLECTIPPADGQPHKGPTNLRSEVIDMVDALRTAGWLTLRHRSLAPLPLAEDLQRRHLIYSGLDSAPVHVSDIGALTIARLLRQPGDAHT